MARCSLCVVAVHATPLLAHQLDNVLILEDMVLAHFLRPVLGAGAPDKGVLELLDDALVQAVAEILHSRVAFGEHHWVIVVWQLALQGRVIVKVAVTMVTRDQVVKLVQRRDPGAFFAAGRQQTSLDCRLWATGPSSQGPIWGTTSWPHSASLYYKPPMKGCSQRNGCQC